MRRRGDDSDEQEQDAEEDFPREVDCASAYACEQEPGEDCADEGEACAAQATARGHG